MIPATGARSSDPGGVKFLNFDGKDGKPVKRYQYTASDDATRIRGLKIYHRHNQANAIDFINTIIDNASDLLPASPGRSSSR